MPSTTPEHKDPWLTNPQRSCLGTVSLAGSLTDTPGLKEDSMRILGSYAFILITAGSAYFRDESGTHIDLKPGDAVLVFPEIAHAYGPKGNASWSQSYVVFDGPAFDLMRHDSALDPKQPIWHLEPVELWNRRISELFSDVRSRNETSALRIVGRFISLLAEMAATHRDAKRSDATAWLDNSLQLLSEPSDKTWLAPQKVAQQVGLSYESFRKRFAQETGESPGQFQKRRRIEHACAAIYQNTASFKELAESLGFCDPYHFSRAFQQVMGESPSAFRKRVRGS